MRRAKGRGCIAQLFGLLVLCAVVVYGVAALTAPWSFHIGERWTPLLSWPASGMLVTKGGTYPLYVFLYPSPRFSKLRMNGMRPTGGVQGTAWLCTSRGVTQYLVITGTIYNGWRSTEGSVIQFRLLEPKYLDVGQRQGYFDLLGRWRGPELVMDDRGEPGGRFRSGLSIEHASVTLNPASYSDFKAVCASKTR